MVLCSLLMLVGRLRDGRVTMFCFVPGYGSSAGVAHHGVANPLEAVSGDLCMPGWFGVGPLACGLFTVRSRLQLRCGWCAVVLAASWSAWFAWVPSRCCRWSYSRMLLV